MIFRGLMNRDFAATLFLSLFLCIFGTVNLSADILSEAEALEKSGKYREAADLYTQWLEKNQDSTVFYKTLLHAAEIDPDPQSEIQTLSKFLPLIKNNAGRYEILIRIAVIRELLGEIDGAQKDYVKASLYASGDDYFRALSASSCLLIEKGEYDSALTQAEIVFRNAESPYEKEKSIILLSKIYIISGETEPAFQILESLSNESTALSTEYYLWIHFIGVNFGSAKMEEEGMKGLARLYPDSPEIEMARGNIAYYPSAAYYMGLYSPEIPKQTENAEPDNPGTAVTVDDPPIVIQAGSFSKKVNAEHLVKELDKKGYDAGIRQIQINDNTYYRVILLDIGPDNLNETLLELKDHGFEGFLLYN